MFSDLFGSEDNDELDAKSWSISGEFHSTNTTLVSVGAINEPPRFPEHPIRQLPTNEQHPFATTDNIVTIIFVPILLTILGLCCCRGGGPPGEQYHRGHLIRERARRIWALEAQKAKRREECPEERLAKIESGVCTCRVIRKDPRTNNCELAELSSPSSFKKKESNLNLPMDIESKMSTDTADTLIWDLDNDHECNDKNENEEDVCPICLEEFNVGETVMFSRSMSCTHVFHKECLMAWLMEQRENECPSCRAALVCSHDDENDNDESKDCNFVACDMPKGGNCKCGVGENDGFLDLEKGTTISNSIVRNCLSTTYSIVRGRIVANHDISEERKPDTINSEILHSVDDKLMLSRPKISTAPMDDSYLLNHRLRIQEREETQLSMPIPLRRVSKSCPIGHRMSRRHNGVRDHAEPTPIVLCDDQRITETTLEQHSIVQRLFTPGSQIGQDNQSSQYQESCNRLYSFSSGEEDDSDDDDAILRLVEYNRSVGNIPDAIVANVETSNASSIFVQSKQTSS